MSVTFILDSSNKWNTVTGKWSWIQQHLTCGVIHTVQVDMRTKNIL